MEDDLVAVPVLLSRCSSSPARVDGGAPAFPGSASCAFATFAVDKQTKNMRTLVNFILCAVPLARTQSTDSLTTHKPAMARIACERVTSLLICAPHVLPQKAVLRHCDKSSGRWRAAIAKAYSPVGVVMTMTWHDVRTHRTITATITAVGA